ncbi:MAG TPA: hypothetical protein VHB98_19010 [Chloroflexota bacterium]|nr:hypothetical protein [Chloroflexota bacterium]
MTRTGRAGIRRQLLGTLRLLIGALVVASVVSMATTAGAATVHFSVFARTGLRLTDIVWTGQRFLYVDNTSNRVLAAGPTGTPLVPFATMPRQVEETRCMPSPGAHGFAAGDIYCHSPDNKIYRISADGKQVTVFATLPHSPTADGALAFDTVGQFGYALIAATGRSGGTTARGGTVFAIDATGKVRRIGTYQDPGGADEIVVAPAGFGSAGGQVLLAVDAGKSGSLVAMSARGQARTLLLLPDGPNPIAVVGPGQVPPAGAAQPGLYVTDTLSRNVFFAPAAELAPFAGDVVVGSELRGLFWALHPHGSGFKATTLPTTLTSKGYNLEGATYVAG